MQIQKQSRAIHWLAGIGLYILIFVKGATGFSDEIFLDMSGFHGDKRQEDGMYKLDTHTLSLQALMTSQSSVWSIEPSPSIQYLAFIKQHASELGKVSMLSLELLKLAGQNALTIDTSIRQYSWHPKKDVLAYIPVNSDCYESKFRKYLGTWTYDVTTGSKNKLGDEGYEVEWARFDESLYILVNHRTEGEFNQVKKWDDTAKKFIETPYVDLHFSPSGKYYYYSGCFETRDSLYERETNTDITDTYVFLKEVKIGQIRKWLNDTICDFYSCHYKDRVVFGIFDCSSGSFYEIDGTPVALIDNGATLIVANKTGGFRKVKMAELPVFCTSILPQEKTEKKPEKEISRELPDTSSRPQKEIAKEHSLKQ